MIMSVQWSAKFAINSMTRNICNRKLSLIIWIHLSVLSLGQYVGRRPEICHTFFFLSSNFILLIFHIKNVAFKDYMF